VDLASLTAIRKELETALVGRRFGKVFPLSRFDLAVDFRANGGRYLFVSTEPANPRTYLITRKLRELEKASVNPSPFHLLLYKNLSGAELTSIRQLPDERVLFFEFSSANDLAHTNHTLVAQLTGKSANLFLLDNDRRVLSSSRETLGDGQQIGERYQPPERRARAEPTTAKLPGENISEYLERLDLEKATAKRFNELASSARGKLRREIAKRETLVGKLEADLAGHGDPVRWKRLGDLLLANTGTARRDGATIWITDYFDDAAPEIGLEVEPGVSLTEEAERYFKRYTKSRNAQREIADRLRTVREALSKLEAQRARLEDAIAAGDEEAVASFAGRTKTEPKKKSGKSTDGAPTGTRTFVSSDGFEILVGKKAKDNDFLTFRVAKSLDTWMHAADYPGSHVVIRNPNRKEIPPRTLLEAAQLAAFYSQGKSQPKAAVHYTQKKFVNKPRGAAAGLVSLASFKTILVEPVIEGATRKSSD
jgi:predicted ribosome quality control (RQC) complex YloA/Tae2 family protein